MSQSAVPPENPHPQGPEPSKLTLIYVLSLCSMVGLTIAAILAVHILRPDEDNSGLIGQVLGLVTPTTAILVGLIHLDAKLQGVHRDVNSRLSQLVAETRRGAYAEGQMAAPGTPQAKSLSDAQPDTTEPADAPARHGAPGAGH